LPNRYASIAAKELAYGQLAGRMPEARTLRLGPTARDLAHFQ
jgi:hypothetical protein